MESTISRSAHLEWCKKRAFEYCDRGDIGQAFASFASDMAKHDETKDHIAIGLGMQMLMGGLLRYPHEMRKFIEGFN